MPSKIYDFHCTYYTIFSGGDFDWCDWGESWYLCFGICCTQGCISNKISSNGGSDSHCCQLDWKESWEKEIASFWYSHCFTCNILWDFSYFQLLIIKANDLHDDHVSGLSFSSPIMPAFFFLFLFFALSGRVYSSQWLVMAWTSLKQNDCYHHMYVDATLLPRSNPPEQLSIHINQESCITMPTINMTCNNSLMKDFKHKSGSV